MLYITIRKKIAVPNNTEIKSFADAFTQLVKAKEQETDRKRIKILNLRAANDLT